MTKKTMPEVDRVAANRAAVASRKERAELKRALRAGEVSHSEVLEKVSARTVPASWRSLRVSDFLGTVEGIGDVGVERAMAVFGFAKGKRLGGVGVRQVATLRTWFSSPRLVEAVMRGRVAISSMGDMSAYELGDLEEHLTDGEIDHADVLDLFDESSAPPAWRSMRMDAFLSTVPGVGRVSLERALVALRLDPSKRLGGLGVRQRRAVRMWLHNPRRAEAVLMDNGMTASALRMLEQAAADDEVETTDLTTKEGAMA